MNIEELHNIAITYTDNMGEVIPGFKFGITNPRLFTKYAYFNFTLQSINKDINREPPAVGGAPGIVVNRDTGEVKVISFSELRSLEANGDFK